MANDLRGPNPWALIWIKSGENKFQLPVPWVVAGHLPDTLSVMRTKSARLFALIFVMTFDR
jgi:hypothetical protein